MFLPVLTGCIYYIYVFVIVSKIVVELLEIIDIDKYANAVIYLFFLTIYFLK